MRFLIIWLFNAVALIAVGYLMPSIRVDGFAAALVAAAIIGLVNMLIKPFLIVLTLPVTILTLGLFIFVINGFLFFLVGHILHGFHVQNMMSGILGAFLYSLISWAFSTLVPSN